MSYWVDCSCGQRLDVEAAQAGTEVACSCGVKVEVPRLSELRRQSDSIALEISPGMVVGQLYGEGRQPVGGGMCLGCGTATDGRVPCTIECEKAFVQGQHSWFFWVLWGLLLPGYLLLYAMVKPRAETIGEPKVYHVSLSLCPKCHGSAGAVKELLLQDSDFARLFDRYPHAQVWTGDKVTE